MLNNTAYQIQEFEYLAVDDQKNDEKRSQPKESTEIQNSKFA